MGFNVDFANFSVSSHPTFVKTLNKILSPDERILLSEQTTYNCEYLME